MVGEEKRRKRGKRSAGKGSSGRAWNLSAALSEPPARPTATADDYLVPINDFDEPERNLFDFDAISVGDPGSAAADAVADVLVSPRAEWLFLTQLPRALGPWPEVPPVPEPPTEVASAPAPEAEAADLDPEAAERRRAMRDLYTMKADRLVSATPDWFSQALRGSPDDEVAALPADKVDAVRLATGLIRAAQYMPGAKVRALFSVTRHAPGDVPEVADEDPTAGEIGEMVLDLPPLSPRLAKLDRALNAFYGTGDRRVLAADAADAAASETAKASEAADQWAGDIPVAHTLFMPPDVIAQGDMGGPVSDGPPEMGPTRHSTGFVRQDTSELEAAVARAAALLAAGGGDGGEDAPSRTLSPLLRLGERRRKARETGGDAMREHPWGEPLALTAAEQLRLMEQKIEKATWLGPEGEEKKPSIAQALLDAEAARNALGPTVLIEASDGSSIVDAARAAARVDAARIMDEIRARRAAENRGEPPPEDDEDDKSDGDKEGRDGQ